MTRPVTARHLRDFLTDTLVKFNYLPLTREVPSNTRRRERTTPPSFAFAKSTSPDKWRLCIAKI